MYLEEWVSPLNPLQTPCCRVDRLHTPYDDRNAAEQRLLLSALAQQPNPNISVMPRAHAGLILSS